MADITEENITIIFNIDTALDEAGVPQLNELGCRDLSTIERVEAVLVEWKKLRKIEDPYADVTRTNAVEEDANFLARLVVDQAKTVHKAYHSDGPWETCCHGHCALVRLQLEKVGLGPELEQIERLG